jgi:thioredoxin 1
MKTVYEAIEPKRAEIDVLEGLALIEFGAPWCGYCRIAQPLIDTALSAHPSIRHIKIEDGKGRRLGRSFGIKLWPTLIFLRNGKETSRLVRPANSAVISEALDKLDAAS